MIDFALPGFTQHCHELPDHTVVVEVAGRSIQAGPAPKAAGAIRNLPTSWKQAGFPEDASRTTGSTLAMKKDWFRRGAEIPCLLVDGRDRLTG